MHTNMRTGRSWRVIPNQDKKLLALGECFAHVLGRDGWRGPLNIQTKYHNGEYIPFEINGRFNGTTSARIELGFDEIRLCIQAFLQLDIGSRKQQSIYCVHRRSNDYAIPREALLELELQGVWHRPA
jgi:carbamoylphosphate synthase large subunit